MYGLINSLVAHPGKREELIALMRRASGDMPGCRAYVIARDATSPDRVWVTEVWESEASHQASLQLPEVAETIARARPLIAGFGERFVTEPVDEGL
jgi:quinol monooxygenase YgiN